MSIIVTDKYYAGIGARKTPAKALSAMSDIAAGLEEMGYILRSGGAVGPDTAFASVVSNKVIYTANSVIEPWAFDTVDEFHPAPHKLSDFVRRLHARNAMILLGPHGDEPVEFVVCWTKSGRVIGGTGQGLRIAQAYGIEIINLGEHPNYR